MTQILAGVGIFIVGFIAGIAALLYTFNCLAEAGDLRIVNGKIEVWNEKMRRFEEQ